VLLGSQRALLDCSVFEVRQAQEYPHKRRRERQSRLPRRVRLLVISLSCSWLNSGTICVDLSVKMANICLKDAETFYQPSLSSISLDDRKLTFKPPGGQ